MSLWKRKLVALAAAMAVAAGLGGLANALDFRLEVVYGLGGALIALFVAFGVPWAFGVEGPFLENARRVKAYKAAVAAYEDQRRDAVAEAQSLVFSYRLRERGFLQEGPGIDPTEGTLGLDFPLIEDSMELVEVGHDEPILSVGGPTEQRVE